MNTFDTLLVANRGEIACRVMRTAKALGLTAVAVHSAVDAGARHVCEADIAIDLGGAKPADSYLAIDKILEAARRSGAQAIHPGYGFLSENAAFARQVEAAGLVFLGPPAGAIEAMGSKSAAKALMAAAGVPLVPGYHGEAQDIESFRAAAARIGYPVLLKAAAGGGGKGMRVVEREVELAEALDAARREAKSAFGDGRLLLEKYLQRPRHVEVQVFADARGRCLYLHDRDCSIQRRHQKVIEEAPAPGLAPALRQAMGEAAVRAAQAIGYVGAGTVEFLLDERGAFYFMEMNTRLQVEHPVTEAISGLDLVAWQIRVARGEPLPITQEQVPLAGHAIEVRLYAEDPQSGFLPASGRLELYREAPAGPGRRIDSGVREGDEVSPFYDPLLAKLIAWGENREEARQRLQAMLADMAIGGLRNNLGFLRRLVGHPAFAATELDTGFIERYRDDLLAPPGAPPEGFWHAAADAWLASLPELRRDDDPHSPWSGRGGWRLGGPAPVGLHLACGGETRRVLARPGGERLAAIRRTAIRRAAVRRGETLFLDWQGEWQAVTQVDPVADARGAQARPGGLGAPMSGSVVRVLVAPGQRVEAGAALVVLEAMKMEHSVRAPGAGTVKVLYCRDGERVAEGTALLELEEAPPAEAGLPAHAAPARPI